MNGDFTTRVPVRYSDIDSYGHVNNATYGSYLEEGRIDYLETVLGAESEEITGVSDGPGMVVANLELDFHRPIGLVDEVTVAVRVPALSESSFPFEYEVRSDGDVAATAETTMVAYDRTAAGSRPLPEAWREAIREFEGL